MGCCASANTTEQEIPLTPPGQNENIPNQTARTDDNLTKVPIENNLKSQHSEDIEIVYNDKHENTKDPESESDHAPDPHTKEKETKSGAPPDIVTVTKSEDKESEQNINQNKVPSSYSPYSPINDRIDINADEDKIQYQIKLEEQELEQKLQNEAKKHFRNTTFETQLKHHQSQQCESLHEVWDRYATNEEKTKMDINSLTAALSVFGMVIDSDRDLQKFVFKTFDSDNNKRWIDYNDFSSSMSSIVASKTDESLLLLFQIFDIDKDGFLEIKDFARILLTQNQIALVTTGKQKDSATIIYSRQQCLKQAQNMVKNNKKTSNLLNINDIKVSFDEFKSIMMNRTDYEMIIDHMKKPSLSFKYDAPRMTLWNDQNNNNNDD